MRRMVVGAALVAVCALGCQTFLGDLIPTRPDYTALPSEALLETAREIEQAVADGNRDFAIADRGGVVVNGDMILQAIRTRAARSQLVDEFRASGHAAEKSNGLIEIVNSKAYKKATTRRQRDRNALLVVGENDNRWAIYEGIRKASHFPPKSLTAIQETFFQARVELLDAGRLYDGPAGALVSK